MCIVIMADEATAPPNMASPVGHAWGAVTFAEYLCPPESAMPPWVSGLRIIPSNDIFCRRSIS